MIISTSTWKAQIFKKFEKVKVWKFSHLKKSAITFAQGCTGSPKSLIKQKHTQRETIPVYSVSSFQLDVKLLLTPKQAIFLQESLQLS